MARLYVLLTLGLSLALSACAGGARTGLQLVSPYTAELARVSEPYPYPYTALHARGGRRLAFVAATHTVDPDSSTMAAIRQAFDTVRPATVIIEGFPSEMGENPEIITEIIEQAALPEADPYARGEAAYAARLAIAAGVPFQGGEPTEAAQTRALLAQGFSVRDVFFADLLKVLPQSIRGGEISGTDDARFEEVFARWTVSLAVERDDAPRIDLDQFAAWYEAQFGVHYRLDARFSDRADPSADTLVGSILRAQSLLRDRHLYGVILQAVRARGRVLVVYGGTHRTTLAPALSAALGPAELWPGPALATATSAAAASAQARE